MMTRLERAVMVALMLFGMSTYSAEQSLAQEAKSKARKSCCRMNMAMDMEEPMESGSRTSGRDTGNLAITFRSEPSPPRTGENAFEVLVRERSGKPVADADVSVTFRMPAMPSMSMPEMRSSVKLVSAGAGVYRGTGDVAMAGRWDVTVSVTRRGQELGTKHVAVIAR